MKYPMHCVAGFFALLCAVKCTGLLTLPARKRVRVSDFLYAGCIFYLVAVFRELVSPASDYFAMLILFWAVMTWVELWEGEEKEILYAGCIFYLVAVFRELVSPASDYFAMLILFWAVMTWVELWEGEEKEILPYAFLSLYLVYAATVKLSTAVLLLLALYPAARLLKEKRWKQTALFIGLGIVMSLYLVYAATVKLSTAVLLLLALYPAARLLKEKRWKQTALFIGLGIVIALPYLIRNVVISGWLFYPFTFFDWFDVDWKISKGYADSDAKEIRAYAMEIFDVYQLEQPFSRWFPNWQLEQPFSRWFPNWLKSQAGLDRILVFAGWAAVPVSAALAVYSVCKGLCEGKKANVRKGAGIAQNAEKAMVLKPVGMEYFSFALLQAAAALGFFFWQFGAPLVRYGYFYVLFLPLTAFGSLYVMAQGAGAAKITACVRDYAKGKKRMCEKERA